MEVEDELQYLLPVQTYQSHSQSTPDGAILGDKNRQTRSIHQPLRGQLQKSIMTALEKFGVLDGRDCCDVGLLESYAEQFDDDGSSDHQIPIHCDDALTDESGQPLPLYDPQHPNYSDANVRLSGILAIEEGSKLFIYDGKDGQRVDTVNLNVGDIVIFRGDCWHAGAKYRKRNDRLHFYVYHSSNPRQRGETYF